MEFDSEDDKELFLIFFLNIFQVPKTPGLALLGIVLFSFLIEFLIIFKELKIPTKINFF